MEDEHLPFVNDTPWIQGEKPVVNWMLRVERRRNQYDRLKQLGKLSVLGLTSILTGYEDGFIRPLEEETNAKSVFKNSYMFHHNKRETNRAILALSSASYSRAEEAFQSFMLTVCLASKEQDFHPTLDCFNHLKLWVYRHMTSDGAVDQICSYFKWLIKACQMLFLGKLIPEPESWFPRINGLYHPFQFAELAFLVEFFEARRITRRLTVDEARLLVQLCNGVRALPYPSKGQMQESVTGTLTLLSQKKVIDPHNMDRYRQGLKQIALRLGKPTETGSHISLTTSACLETPQSKGGKAAYMVGKAKECLCQALAPEELQELENLRDHLGFIPFERGISKYLRPGIELHDVAYLPTDKAEEYLSNIDIFKERVPYDYGKSILLITSKQLVEDGLGHFIGQVENRLKIPLFRSKTKFVPQVSSIKTRASLVQEKGMKTRLVTTTNSAKAQIEQLFSHMVRGYLAKDPFHQVGFDEPDKLWQTLKRFEKHEAL
jgi:hypothetical protein